MAGLLLSIAALPHFKHKQGMLAGAKSLLCGRQSSPYQLHLGPAIQHLSASMLHHWVCADMVSRTQGGVVAENGTSCPFCVFPLFCRFPGKNKRKRAHINILKIVGGCWGAGRGSQMGDFWPPIAEFICFILSVRLCIQSKPGATVHTCALELPRAESPERNSPSWGTMA